MIPFFRSVAFDFFYADLHFHVVCDFFEDVLLRIPHRFLAITAIVVVVHVQ